MADGTKIEWTDATWNPITGCSVVSPGCTNCYAMRLAGTRLAHVASRAGLTRDSKAGPVWTGEVRFNESCLTDPLRWQRPRMIFVAAHGDLFHESVPDEWIDRVFGVMALAPRHTFQVLTKRSARMRRYLTAMSTPARIALAAPSIPQVGRETMVFNLGWPLNNLWLGVSTEDQQRADERIPDLLATPAAVRWISAEPMLGPLRLDALAFKKTCDCVGHSPTFNAFTAEVFCSGCCEGAERVDLPGLDWVVAGGESGPGARPMHPDWARSLRDQCAAAGVAFHFKQWGEWLPWAQKLADGSTNLLAFGKDPARFRELGDAVFTSRVGKARAGRLLDGRTHEEFPA